ncbi:hypothetical protein NC651_030465 [Populus alba x Populus x berolinensis]|nr:hypothetical protein NC651_030465 [Populus alba x Populus x berolinensis]
MEAIEELSQLSESIMQAAAVLADEDVDENSSSSSRRNSTFLNVVALGNVEYHLPPAVTASDIVNTNSLNQSFSTKGAGKSAVLNSVIGHPVLPNGENGATRAPISIGLQRDVSLSSKLIILQSDNKSQQHSLQDRPSKGAAGKSRDEIYLKLRISTAPTLKLIDLTGLDQQVVDESMVSDYAEHNDAIFLVIVPAAQAPEIASSRALRFAKEYDGEGNRTVGVISKIDQAASDWKALAAVQALLLNQGPPKTADIPWIALIGQSVSIAAVQSGNESSLETAWKAENESPQSKLGRIALVDALAQQIHIRMKVRLPNLLSGLQGKSQIVQDELVRLGEQMVQSAEGTRAIASELCREFEEKFLQHIMTGEGSGWKIVASFEGNFPNRIKELPLDRHFDINNVKRIVLEADGYQPYLISPEKGLRSLIGSRRNPIRQRRKCRRGTSLEFDLHMNKPLIYNTCSVEDKSAKTNGWSKRSFVLNEKTGKLGYTKKQEERHFRGVITLEECNIEEVPDEEEPPPKSSKDKKANGPDAKAPSLIFKITSKVPYKTVLKAHSAVVLKAESMADKVEWMNKISKVAQPSKGGQMRGVSPEGGPATRESISGGSLDLMARRPVDPEEELRWMSQEVRGYVEAVLNSLAANVPKQLFEKAKEDMLNQLYNSISAQSTARIEELLQEDKNVKPRREHYQKQSSLLSKLTRQLSIHDNRAAAASSSWPNGDRADEAAVFLQICCVFSTWHDDHFGLKYCMKIKGGRGKREKERGKREKEKERKWGYWSCVVSPLTT